MKHTTSDDDGKQFLLLAILIIAIAIAAILIPSPPDEVPVIEKKEEARSLIEHAYASELDHVVEPDKMVVDKPVESEKIELDPELAVICSCESKGIPDGKPNHYESDGVTVLTGRVEPRDRGMCQINSYYWGAKATELGYDIETPNGNIQMANFIYETQGSQPWSASKKCHGK